MVRHSDPPAESGAVAAVLDSACCRAQGLNFCRGEEAEMQIPAAHTVEAVAAEPVAVAA